MGSEENDRFEILEQVGPPGLPEQAKTGGIGS